jgi:hypothetical protein
VLGAALALALAAGPRLEVEAWAGGGYDSNVSHDPSSEAAVGSALVTGAGAIGAWRPLGRAWDVYAGGLVSGTEVLDVSDLSGASAELELSIGAFPWRRVALTAGAWGGRAWYRDDARDAWLLAATAGMRLRVSARAVLGLRYERSHDDASDPVYSTTRDRLVLRVSLRALPAVRLRASYAWTWADEVFYPVANATAASVGAQGDGRGGGGGTRRTPGGPVTSSFPGAERQVVQAPALTGTARAGVELALSDHVYLDVAGAYARVDSEAGDYDALTATGVVGWRR